MLGAGRRARFCEVALLALVAAVALVRPAACADWPELSSGPLQDNSFLIEEAYNQDAGVVQHIVNGVWDRSTGNWTLSYTQEWPVPDVTNQLSFTVLHQWGGDTDDTDFDSGIGPMMLNYRYQASTEDECRPAVAPRLSVLRPTGGPSRNLGGGRPGVQLGLPVSKQITRHWAANLNLSGTIFPSVEAPAEPGRHHSLVDGTAGASVIWEPFDAINFLCEVVVNQTEEVTRRGTEYHTHPLVNPGMRVGWNGPGGVQWVMGIAAPIGFGTDAGERGVFLYFSLEHAVTAAARRERDW